MEWFYIKNGERIGPVQAEAIRSLILEGALGADDMVWNKTMGEKWSKISDVYIFAVHFQKTSADSNVEFGKRLEEKRQREARERTAGTLKIAIALVVAIALIGGWLVWKRGADHRLRGVDATNPLGTLTCANGILADTYKMAKETAEKHPFIPATELTGVTYSRPKEGTEDHVSAQGMISIYSSGDRIEQIYAEFPSPGPRGPLWIDKSIAGIQMDTLWHVIGAPERKDMKFIKDAPTGLATRYGLSKLPAIGVFGTFDGPTVTGLWIETGQYGEQTMVIFRTK